MTTSIGSNSNTPQTDSTTEDPANSTSSLSSAPQSTGNDSSVTVESSSNSDDDDDDSSSGDDDSSSEGVALDFVDDLTAAMSRFALTSAINSVAGSVAGLKSGDLVRSEWAQAGSDQSSEGPTAEIELEGQPTLDATASNNSQWWKEHNAESIFSSVVYASSDANADLSALTRRSGTDVLLESGNFEG
jgi:hypothetical protein